MATKRRIRKTNDGGDSNNVKDMPFSVKDGEKAVILESIPDPMVLLDTDLKIVWSNDAMNKLVNLNSDQLAGRHCFEKIHGLKSPCSICPVVKAINTGQPCTVDDLSSLGKKWALRAYPLRDEKGNITRVVETVTDITESKRAGKKLNRVRKLQSMILENSTVGIAFVRNRIYEWVNPKLCELYGIPKEQFIGSSTRLTYPDDESYQKIGAEVYSLFSQGKNVAFETLRRKGDGSLIWCKLEGIALDTSNPDEGSIWIAEDITKRKQAEEDLQKLNRLQSVILDNSTVGIALIRNRVHEWVNPRLCEIYDIPKEQLEGSPTRTTYPDEESYQNQGNEIYSLLARGEKATIETHMRKGDGTLFWCQLEGKALDASKPDEGSIWIVEDITKRKQAEEEIRKLNKLQSVILDNSAVGIAFVRNRTFEWVNRKMSELFGIPMERLQGSSTRIIYPNEEIFKSLGSEGYSLLAQGKKATLETQMRKGDGMLFWYKLEGIALDPSNPQDGSIWIFEDITEQKLAEEALRKSEEKFRGLVEGLNEALFRMTLPSERFEYFSPSVTNVLGYSAEEFIADPLLIRRAIHPDFQNFINEKFEELKKGIVSPTFEYKIIDSKGKERWIIQSNKGIFDDNGKLVALEGLCRDISERKRAEDALEKRIVALTMPLGDVENIAFEDLFNLPDLQRLQDMIADTWGVAVLLTRPDGTAITRPSNFTNFCEFVRKGEKGLRNCQKSDAELGRYNPSGPIINKCLSADLWGAGASITVGGRHIASWLIGQVRNEAQSEEQIMEYARDIGIDDTTFREAFLQIPVMSQEKFEQIAHTLFALANQLSNIAYQNIQQARFITERKQAEEALQESEKQVRRKLNAILSPEGDISKLELSDIIDAEKIQKLMDEFFDLTNLPMTITDLKGKVLVGIGWQDICTNFHRVNPESCRLCIESDLELTNNVPVGTFKKYRCKNNMWDIATPIMLGNKSVGNIFMGQFLFDGEKPDYETFRQQARKYGFDEQEYIAALDRVPHWSEKTINKAMSFFSILAEIIGNLGYSNIKLANALEERKRAEEALRESEERFNLSMEATNDGLWDWNIKTDKGYFSPGYYRMLGYESDAFPSKGSIWKELIHPDDFEHAVQANIDCIEGRNEHFDVEYRMKARDGGWRWILGRGKCVARDEHGYALRLVGTHVDITDRKRAEEALRKSEEKYRRLHESMTEAFASVDMKGRIQESNRAFQSMLGYSEEVLRRLKYSDITPKKWHAMEKSIVKEQILVHGYSNVYEKEYQRKDGSVFPVEISSFLIRDSAGNPIGIWGIVRDITERKRMETELNAAKNYLRTVFNNVYDAIFVHDLDGKIVDVNNKMLEMYKVSREEALGFNVLRDFSVTDETMEESRVNWNMVISGENYFVPWKARRPKDGSIFDVEVFLTRLVLPDGNYILANVRDITERKQLEEERSKMESRMREVHKLESLGVLAGGIAHDFNNLLMAILGRADLALFSLSETSPAYQHVEEITRASHRAADLCRQMLAYSGKGRFVIGRYNISEIVREMGQILNVSISKNAMVRYSLADELPAVESDATQIRQVVMNLITNASDALGDGQGIISVKTGVMECDEAYLSSSYLDDKLPGGTYVYIEVSDTGCGMDSETLSRIFDPFFSKKFTGRGLGLAAVLGIVRGHKGAIKVYSEVGKGTTFKILLPAVEWKSGDKVKTEEQPPLLKGGGTILVVDDDPLVRDVASDMLIQLGFQVLTANNGREGLNVFKAHGNEVLCIILDLTMPEMGGEEAFLELRKLKKDVKVILSSGYNEQDVTQRFVGKGLAGFIQKPYTLAGLRSALNRALG